MTPQRKTDAQVDGPRLWEGQIVDGLFPLREFLGGNETGAVFETEYEGKRAAIKVVIAAGRSAEQRLWHWRLASKVSNPHLIQLFKVGRSQLGTTAVAYVVMEFAEENLAQVLPERPLTSLEAKDMLRPALEALACVHRDGFVYGCLKPANVMAANDCLKLASESLRRIGDSDDLPAPQGAYRAPELETGGKLSTATDIWALGVTLVEVLTQQLPTWTGADHALVLPDGISGTDSTGDALPDIIRHCLRPFPQERWSLAEISARLEQQPPAPKKSRMWLFALPAVAFVLFAVWMALRSSDTPSSAIPEPQRTSANPENGSPSQPAVAAPFAAEPASPASSAATAPVPSQPSATPSDRSGAASETNDSRRAPPSSPPSPSRSSTPAPDVSQPVAAAPTVAAAVPTSATAEPASTAPASAAPEAPAAVVNSPVSPDVVSQVMPEILTKARRSIQGKVNVAVKVHSDAYGVVKDAVLETPGVSRYFSTATLKAVRRWKFRPVKSGEVFVPQDWMVRFEFTRADTKVAVERVAP